MSKIYGYVRISTKKQSIERQIKNILQLYPTANIKSEIYTGRRTEGRAVWNLLYKEIKTGDTIVFDEVSRMSRNAKEGFKLYKELFAKGVNLVFIKEPHINIDTYRNAMTSTINVDVNTADENAAKLLNDIFDALNSYMFRLAEESIRLAFDRSQAEVDYLSQRTIEGLNLARENGKQIGNTAGSKRTTQKSIKAKELIKKHSKNFGGSLTDGEVMQLAKCTHNTYYKYKRELLQEI